MTDSKTPKPDMPDAAKGAGDPAFLDSYFEAARGAAMSPSDSFMARLQHDATLQQAAHLAVLRAETAAASQARLTPRAGQAGTWWRQGLRRVVQWAAPMGGAPGIAGMASVALAGVWLGFVAPAPVGALETWMIGAEADFIDAETALLAEIDTFLTGDAANEY